MSLIVLQHNPPPIMAQIFTALLKLINPNGVAYIQMPTFIDKYSFEIEKYNESPKSKMEMNCLPQKDIFDIVAKEGCFPLEIREDGWTGDPRIISNTFLIQKRI
jgi:hypothetical protein